MIEDCRAEVVGGIIAGLEIWEVAVIPYLMNNSDTWAYMPKQALDVLDSLQNQFLRSLLATPRGSPTPALLWETGTSTMENRILKRKLTFAHHLTNLPEESLAWQVAALQDKFSLPGLMTEIKEVLSELDMPDMKKTPKFVWKNIVNQKMKEKNKTDILKQSERYKKINTDDMKTENFERKPYLTNLRMDQARTKFKMKTKMLKNVKMNYKNDPKNVKNLWQCSECQHIDSQEHILWCKGYETLRANKDLSNDVDLTRYYQQVLLQREKTEPV